MPPSGSSRGCSTSIRSPGPTSRPRSRSRGTGRASPCSASRRTSTCPSSVDDLFEAIPADLRLSEPLDLAPGLAEQEVVDELGRLAARNRSLDELVCFAGRGAYDHYIPSVVWALAGRSEFSTAYTPYQ